MRSPVRTNYSSWRGKIVYGANVDVNEYYDPETNTITLIMNADEKEWKYLGVSPVPRTRSEWFWWDYHHGMLMRYPRTAVIAFAIRQWLKWNEDSSKFRRGEA